MSLMQEWKGGENPAPGRAVSIEQRDGIVELGLSDTFRWTHALVGDEGLKDIVRYMVVEPAKDLIGPLLKGDVVAMHLTLREDVRPGSASYIGLSTDGGQYQLRLADIDHVVSRASRPLEVGDRVEGSISGHVWEIVAGKRPAGAGVRQEYALWREGYGYSFGEAGEVESWTRLPKEPG